MWQFIRGTGRMYGLEVSALIDDRRDPVRATEAAVAHLGDLYREFEDWYLALAAYNYGPNRIPLDGGVIPGGANWYSGYIFRHLTYVLGDAESRKPFGDALYSELGQSTLVTFAEPYRAAAFVESLEQQAPGLNLDWFRRGIGKFEVVMTYADRDEFDANARKLRGAGFRVD